MTYLDLVPDPSGYREAAAVLRRRAEDLAYYAQRIDRTVESTAFEGPAADAFRGTMAGQRSVVLHLCGELHSYANSIAQAAAVYEAQRAELAASGGIVGGVGLSISSSASILPDGATPGGLRLDINHGPIDISGHAASNAALQGLTEQMIEGGMPAFPEATPGPYIFDSTTEDYDRDGRVDAADHNPTDGSRG